MKRRLRGGRLFVGARAVMGNINFHFIRHVPVITPGGLWYGEDIEIDLDSDDVKSRFNYLSGFLPHTERTSLIISSPYRRALATAAGILKILPADFEKHGSIIKGFAEQNYGDMKDRLHKDIQHEDHVVAYMGDTWNNPPRNGESLEMFQSRIAKSLAEVTGQLDDSTKDVIIFCHGGVQMAALAIAKGTRMTEIKKERFNGKKLDTSYMSVLTLGYSLNDGSWAGSFRLDPGLQKREPTP